MSKKEEKVETRADKYKVVALTFGERADIMDESSIMDASGNMVIKTGTTRILTVKKGVRKDGKELTDEQVRNMDEPLGNELYLRVLRKSRIPLEI